MEVKTAKHIELNVKGMTCTNCALGIERYLKKEGLDGVNVDFSSEEVIFDLPEDKRLPLIIKGIEKLGYEVVPEEQEASTGLSKIERLFYFSLIFTVPLLLHMFLPWHLLHNPWFQLAMALPVYAVGMYHFGRSAWRSIQSGVPNMDVLIALGTTAAFFYSLYGTLMQLGPDFLFFETAASIITIVLLGNVLEHRSVQKTTTALKALTQLQEMPARLIHSETGTESVREIDARQVRKGDLLQVNTGDRIPVDGLVTSGGGEVDESMISGESDAVSKAVDSKLIGGSLLLDGSLRMRATQVGKETVLASIIEMVKKAQADKPEIQQLADKVSAIFVPVVLAIAALTFGISYGLVGIGLQASIIHSVAVLVIACPCAMGLATPTAVVVGIGRATQNGMLIKGGRTLEQFSTIERVVFDKTGTLTTGAFELAAIHSEGESDEQIRRLLFSLEQHSSHPIARSVVKALEGVEVLPLASVSESRGVGIDARDTAGNHYQLGSFRIAQGLTQDLSHSLYLIRNNELIATVDLADELKPGAREAIAFLHEKGIETVMLSGDRKEKCAVIAKELGIDTVYAEQLPAQKLALIEAFAAEKPTAMVGDGINDAPALARATLGISLSNATEVAIQSAQIVLLRGDLTALPKLFGIGKHTLLTIRQNLFWAFFYNVLAIPLAATGFLSPMVGAMTMALSDVVVIGNSLRLKVKKVF